MITYRLEKAWKECDCDCLHCDMLLQQYCCESSEEEKEEENK